MIETAIGIGIGLLHRNKYLIAADSGSIRAPLRGRGRQVALAAEVIGATECVHASSLWMLRPLIKKFIPGLRGST
jgi:hypothetical protein